MDATWIVPVFVRTDTVMEQVEPRRHGLAHVPDAEIITGAVPAAPAVANQHARALHLLSQLGYLSGRISISRFNRRLPALADWLALLADTLGERRRTGDAVVIDRLPLPVGRRARARRCRKVRGRL